MVVVLAMAQACSEAAVAVALLEEAVPLEVVVQVPFDQPTTSGLPTMVMRLSYWQRISKSPDYCLSDEHVSDSFERTSIYHLHFATDSDEHRFRVTHAHSISPCVLRPRSIPSIQSHEWYNLSRQGLSSSGSRKVRGDGESADLLPQHYPSLTTRIPCGRYKRTVLLN